MPRGLGAGPEMEVGAQARIGVQRARAQDDHAGAVFPEGEHVRAALPAEAAPLAGRGGVFRDLVGAGGDPEACRIRDDDRGEGRTRELAAIVAMAVHEPQQLARDVDDLQVPGAGRVNNVSRIAERTI